jgi:hypothetical protein
MTRWFVLPRFGSCKPTPRWGGHKDQVSFNLFPLSNGHLDRVSFLLNQMGHLDPIRTTTQLMSLALITSHLRIRMGIEESTIAKAKRQERQITHRSLSLSQVTNTNDHLSQLWNLERLEALIVSWNGLLALVLNVKDWNAWVKWMEVVGVVFIAPNHFLAVAPILPTADGPRSWSGRSTPAHQRLETQRSAVTAISTAIFAFNASSDVR